MLRPCSLCEISTPRLVCQFEFSYLWLVGNGRMVVVVVIIVPHSSIHY